MPYQAEGIDQRAEVKFDAGADSVSYWPRLDGEQVVPTAATARVLDPGGVEKATPIVTIDGATGRMSISQAWPEASYPLDEDYRVEWTFTVAGVVHADTTYFDIVRSKLLCSVAPTDLLEHYPDLERQVTALGSGVSLARFIKRAWSEMLDRLRSGGVRPSLILDRSRVHNVAVRMALSMACDALSKQPGDIWSLRETKHSTKADSLFTGLGEMKVDIDEDATASSGETKAARRRFTV